MKIQGAITALITPFRDGKVDRKAFENFVQWQIEQGIHGLVPCGTTGESPTLSHEEHNVVIEWCVKTAAGKVPVIAGTGSNSTDEAVMMTKHAQKVGADAALIVSPYYNKPTPEGIYQHYAAIHSATDIPLIIYNIPGRSVVNISDDVLARLAELPRIIGVKDATGDLMRPWHLDRLLGKKAGEFVQLSGEDATALPFNEQGGVGCISVTSNIAPALCAKMQELWLSGERNAAYEIHRRLLPLHDVMFCETSPAPVKYAASLLGLCNDELRLPMVEPSQENKVLIKGELKAAGLL